jgi:leucyl/phenylalanyl-tRNA--protein transferase
MPANPPPVTDDPHDMLWHYASGRYPSYLDDQHTPVVWKCYSHRGVQPLDEIVIPKSQRRYVYSEAVEVRFNTAFEQVVAHCADPARDDFVWITAPLVRAYNALHRLGYAHSFEAWQDGKLVGGGFGVQVGGVLGVESMFHLAPNVGKAAYGRLILRARDRGYRLVDVGTVATHRVNYGERYLPQWQFEQTLHRHLSETPSLTDDRPTPPLPWRVRTAAPLARKLRSLTHRVVRLATSQPDPAAAASPPEAAAAEGA